jgi:hypothetical protein
MITAPHQQLVLGRTGRRVLPVGCVSRDLERDRVLIHGLLRGEWCQDLGDSLLAEAWVHVDLKSAYFSTRHSRPDASKALGHDWGDLILELPGDLGSGEHRIRIAVTVALPGAHGNGGRILARSPDIVLVEGPDGGAGRASILPIRPSESVAGICRLQISEDEGPVLEVSKRVQGLGWKELARNPYFKFGVLAGCIQQVLLHLAFQRDGTPGWGEAWLGLPGVKGRDLPDLEDGNPEEAYRQASEWALECSEACVTALDLEELFREAAGLVGGEE